MAPPTSFLSILSEEFHSVLAGVIGGAKYGVKIRLPHALVMTFLFRSELDTKQKVRNVLKVVFEHASNLALFAAVYKTILASLKWMSRHTLDTNQREGVFRALGRSLISMIGTKH